MRRQLIVFCFVLTVLIFYTASQLKIYFQDSWLTSLVLAVPLFFLMFGTLFISRANPTLTEKKWYQIYSAIGSLVMGLWGTFIILSIAINLLRLIFLTIWEDQFLSTFEVLELYLLPAAGVIAILGFFEALRGPKIKHVLVRRDHVTTDLDHFKIAQISDLHIGPTIRQSYVNKVIQKTNSQNPDIIVLTGDIIDSDPQSVQPTIDLLSQLKARYGVYYVTGNHEYYWGIEDILASLKKTGILTLLNENKILSIQNSTLMLAGITDPAARGIYLAHAPNIEKASATNQPSHFKILLAHQPGVFSLAEKFNFDLQLSGHTHGGQFFPFNLIVNLVHKYSQGLHLHGKLHVYVNAGTGYWGPINRFGVPAEITILELRSNVG